MLLQAAPGHWAEQPQLRARDTVAYSQGALVGIRCHTIGSHDTLPGKREARMGRGIAPQTGLGEITRAISCRGMVETELDRLIQRADTADPQAVDTLFTLLYGELHCLAESALRRGGGSFTLSPTTLLHEAYLNMAGRDDVTFPDRARFLAYASRAMRGLVIDFARRRQAEKRGRHLEITLPGEEPVSGEVLRTSEELTRLGDALGELAAIAPALAEVVDLHFFCGFSFAEIAALRRVSERTVQREWRKARLLLHHTLLG